MSRVAVLHGGISSEREVSLVSGAACADALERLGHTVARLDVGADVGRLVEDLADFRPDAAFNALHGRFGEDGCIQGLLNLLTLPYTHSGLTASAVAMDKPIAKSVFQAAGIPVAPHRLVDPAEAQAGDPLPRPYVIKPAQEGSSVGVHVVLEGSNRAPLTGWSFGEQVMVEAFIPGRELTVSVMDGRPLAVTEIRTTQGFYDYRNKYTAGQSEHVLPAPVPDDVYQRCLDLVYLK